jgi:predicted nucleic acid-binding protein
MGTQFLIDTNALSDYLGRKFSDGGMDFMHLVVNNDPYISVMTQIELLSYLSPKIDKIRAFVALSNVYELTEPIIAKTIALRRSRRIKIPDAIIAATALVHNFTLITHNISDFEGIPSLRLLDVHSL